MKTFFAVVALLTMSTTAQSATLVPIDLTDATRIESARSLFGAEIKRDQNVNDNGARGNDAFLRDATSPSASSFNVGWGVSGTAYAWSIGYDGNIATLSLGSESKLVDVSDGTWNALSLFVRASDDALFSTVTTLLSITKANGSDLLAPLAVSATNGNTPGTFSLDGLGPISSLEGTLSFSFATIPGATGSPNSRVAVNFGAIEAVPAAVPVPAGLPLLVSAIGAVAVLSRRRRKAA